MMDIDYNSPAYTALRDQARPDWQAYTGHAFVTQLGQGILDKHAFIHYLIQDYVFLKHFARAWGLALVKAQTMGEMKFTARTLDTLVNHEMQLHIGICAEHGIGESVLFNTQEELENLAYTRYVLDSGLQGDFLDMLAALAPCVLGYGEIGIRLKREGSPGNPYQDWIDIYCGKEYQNFCGQVGELIEQATVRRLGEDYQNNPRWAALSQRFNTATRLEVGFWDMGLRGASD